MPPLALKLQQLDEAEQSQIVGLQDTYPPDEYTMKITMRDSVVSVVFTMTAEAMAERGFPQGSVPPAHRRDLP